ncbi:8124_t:CDS:2, partial [Dentiscutata erythropus]
MYCFPWRLSDLLKHSDDTKLIPREYLYGNANKLLPKISHDGEYLAFIAQSKDIMNIFVSHDLYDLSHAKPITFDKNRGIREFWWTYDNRILYSNDKNGDEGEYNSYFNICLDEIIDEIIILIVYFFKKYSISDIDYKIYSVNIDTNDVTCLTPFDNVQSKLIRLSPKFPNDIIIKINMPDPTTHSLYKINQKTLEITQIEKNSQSFNDYFVDDSLRVRCASKDDGINGKEIYVKYENSNKWRLIISYNLDDANSSNVISLDNEGTIYLLDSHDGEFNSLYKLDINDKELELIAKPSDQKADINKVLFHPATRRPLAYSVTYLRDQWYHLDEKILHDLVVLSKFDDSEFDILSQSLDNSIWTMSYESGNKPPKYYLYNRNDQSIHHLFDARPELEQYKLGPVFPLIIQSRDKLNLVCYLTLPAEKYDSSTKYKPKKPLPLILHVHGGPWNRDYYCFKADSQLFANRGYAVLNINYRSSVGLGKSLIRVGIGQWGKKMNDDLIDAVRWAIRNNIAIKEKIAIYGKSYGGYATLAGLAFTNVKDFEFACGIEFAGPSDLGGDPDTDKGREYLESCSPSKYADNIKKPLLIAQGKNDPRVKYEKHNEILESLKRNKISVGYVLYCDEGHGFVKPKNMLSFAAFTEKFLSTYLGGRCEQYDKDEFENLNLKVECGKNLLGLS